MKKQTIQKGELQIEVVKEESKIVDGTQYSVIHLCWSNPKTHSFDLRYVPIKVLDSNTGEPINKKDGWLAMTESRPAVLGEDSQKKRIKTTRERYIYILSKNPGSISLSIDEDSFSYDGRVLGESFYFDYQAEQEVSSGEVISVPYIITEVLFSWNYHTIYANGRHQLEFDLIVTASSGFDPETGDLLPPGQGPVINGQTLTLTDDPTLSQFEFKHVDNNVVSDLKYFNSGYQPANSYLHVACPGSAFQRRRVKAPSALPPDQTQQIYTFYIVADNVGSEDICVNIPLGPTNLAFPFDRGCADISENIITAQVKTEYEFRIDATQGQYAINHSTLELESVDCDATRASSVANYNKFSFSEYGYPNNIATETFFDQDLIAKSCDEKKYLNCYGFNYPSDANYKISMKLMALELYQEDADHNHHIILTDVDQMDTTEGALELLGFMSVYKDGTENPSGTGSYIEKVDVDKYKFAEDTDLFFIAHKSTFIDDYWQDITYNPTFESSKTGTEYTNVDNNNYTYHIIDSFGNQSKSNLRIINHATGLTDGTKIGSDYNVINLFP